MRRCTWVLLPALLAAAAGTAHAHRDTSERQRCAARDEEPSARYDRDRDGRLDAGERQSWRADRRRQGLLRYDRDHDGRLDPQERARKHRDRAIARFQRLDGNGDGYISRGEANTATCARFIRRFGAIDRSGDGRVTWEEFAAACSKLNPARRRR